MRELIFKLAVGSGDPVARAPSPVDLSEYVTPWVNYLLAEGRAAGTLKLYSRHVEQLLRQHPYPTLADMQDFLAARAAKVKASALQTTVQSWRSYFHFLMLREVIEFNPALPLKAPPNPRRERQIPSPHQVARLASSPIATVQDRTVVLVLAACGLRISELLQAQRSDVRLAEPPAIRVIGKGDKERRVPMAHEAARSLERHLRDVPAGCRWLFPGRDAAKPMTPQAVDMRFGDLCESAGIPRITPHQLRHYFASVLLSHGVNIKIVSRLMGHASPTVTANVYWHLMDEGELLKAYQENNPLKQVNDEIARMATGQLSLDFGGHDFGGEGGAHAKRRR